MRSPIRPKKQTNFPKPLTSARENWIFLQDSYRPKGLCLFDFFQVTASSLVEYEKSKRLQKQTTLEKKPSIMLRHISLNTLIKS